MTSTDLAATHGLGKGSVLKLLRESGTALRFRGLTSDQIAAAVELYTEGWSLKEVSEHLRVNDETVRQALLARGVAMRPRGRRRKPKA